MSVEVRTLEADEGECIWLKYGTEDNVTNVIIDSGPESSSENFASLVNRIKQQYGEIELLILTHIDDDHIGGLKRAIEDYGDLLCNVKELWLNIPNVNEVVTVTTPNQSYSPKLASDLVDLLKAKKVNVNVNIHEGKIVTLNEGKFYVLNPGKKEIERLENSIEQAGVHISYKGTSDWQCNISDIQKRKTYRSDGSDYNRSSIAFLFEYKEISILFMGDAAASTVVKYTTEINKKLKNETGYFDIDLFKLSHHGSNANVSPSLLSMFKTTNYLVCTNGTNNNPKKSTLAEILKERENPVSIYCNYKWWIGWKYFTKDDLEEYVNTHKLILVPLNEQLIEVKKGLKIGNV